MRRIYTREDDGVGGKELYLSNVDTYQKRVRAVLSPAEHLVFKKLNSPHKIQDFLDTLSINFDAGGDILIHSPRNVLERQKAQCIEGALFAAAALAYHGREPWLVDFQTTSNDEDHVVAVFKEHGLWGAISKTNHPVLRWRDPIYKTVRELAMSYFHEYYLWDGGPHNGKKTLRAYSRPFNLRRYAPERWVTLPGDLDWLAVELDDSPHSPVVPKKMLSKLRNASLIETQAMQLAEWRKSVN